jgi:hypothetical protein
VDVDGAFERVVVEAEGGVEQALPGECLAGPPAEVPDTGRSGRWKWPAVAVLALAVPSGALLWNTAAGADGDESNETTAMVEAEPGEVELDGLACVAALRWDEASELGSDAEVMDAYMASINADVDAIAAHLEAKGIDHTVTVDAYGMHQIEYDDEAGAAVDEYYEESGVEC